MFEEQVDQPVEDEDDSAADVEGAAATGDTEPADGALADAVDQQAAASDGATAETAPEVPDNASDTIARAQEHIDKLNMEKEREAAKRQM